MFEGMLTPDYICGEYRQEKNPKTLEMDEYYIIRDLRHDRVLRFKQKDHVDLMQLLRSEELVNVYLDSIMREKLFWESQLVKDRAEFENLDTMRSELGIPISRDMEESFKRRYSAADEALIFSMENATKLRAMFTGLLVMKKEVKTAIEKYVETYSVKENTNV